MAATSMRPICSATSEAPHTAAAKIHGGAVHPKAWLFRTTEGQSGILTGRHNGARRRRELIATRLKWVLLSPLARVSYVRPHFRVYHYRR
jgi:hypothetical protein